MRRKKYTYETGMAMKPFYILLIVSIVVVVGVSYVKTREEEERAIELHTVPFYIPRKVAQTEQVRNGVPLVIYES